MSEIDIIKINNVRDYIDVMYKDVKPIEKGYQVHLGYDGYDIKRVIEYFYEIEQENQQLKEQLKHHNEIVEYSYDLMLKSDKYKSVLDEIREYINNYDVFKEFSFPLMKRDEENQVKSSIDYEFQTSIKKSLLQILDKAGKE